MLGMIPQTWYRGSELRITRAIHRLVLVSLDHIKSNPLVRLMAMVLDMNDGSIGSMKKLGITESYKLKRQVVLSASEAAEMIIR
jgi:chaperonin GroEL (HSP60 family)